MDSCISCIFYSSPFFQTAASNLFFGKKKSKLFICVWCIPPAERERERGGMNWGSSFFLRVPRGLHSDRDERFLGLRERQTRQNNLRVLVKESQMLLWIGEVARRWRQVILILLMLAQDSHIPTKHLTSHSHRPSLHPLGYSFDIPSFLRLDNI